MLSYVRFPRNSLRSEHLCKLLIKGVLSGRQERGKQDKQRRKLSKVRSQLETGLSLSLQGTPEYEYHHQRGPTLRKQAFCNSDQSVAGLRLRGRVRVVGVWEEHTLYFIQLFQLKMYVNVVNKRTKKHIMKTISLPPQPVTYSVYLQIF